jgi:hypothetical protein
MHQIMDLIIRRKKKMCKRAIAHDTLDFASWVIRMIFLSLFSFLEVKLQRHVLRSQFNQFKTGRI